jgi:hypothetical protein
MFDPFKIPDFVNRPDGRSMSLKDAYVGLRRLGFPDKDIFIFAQGEFNSFKGEIIRQEPQAGDMVYPGNRVILTAAVAGICQMMPDLFTYHIEGELSSDKDPRQGTKKLFAVFDSAILKMLCRLEWVRDIYAGIHRSPKYLEYLNKLFSDPKIEINDPDFRPLGFISSRLSQYAGTEAAVLNYFEQAADLQVSAEFAGNHKVPLPKNATDKLGKESKIGENVYLGDNFQSEKSEIKLGVHFDKAEDIDKTMKLLKNEKTLTQVFRAILPYYLEKCDLFVAEDSENVEFACGKSNLGFNSRLNADNPKEVDIG